MHDGCFVIVKSKTKQTATDGGVILDMKRVLTRRRLRQGIFFASILEDSVVSNKRLHLGTYLQ